MVIYDKYDIVFQEIPNEVSLAFTLKACQNRCVGCHSAHLREEFGNELTDELIYKLLHNYAGEITNVLFLGEGNDKSRLIQIMNMFANNGLKISIYSGRDEIDIDYLEHVDYYKVGSYKEQLGGLDSVSTNQKLFKINAVDITNKLTK